MILSIVFWGQISPKCRKKSVEVMMDQDVYISNKQVSVSQCRLIHGYEGYS